MCAIVGKPNVGKSTFFSAITLIPVEISSRPFTTVKPNVGIGYLKTECVCKEFNVRDNPVNSICKNGIRYIPVELLDCAGLVPGSHLGRGLGNRFLDEIRRADSIIHIVDASGSTDAEGNYCRPGTRDPVNDVKFLEEEIALWFSRILREKWRKVSKLVETERRSFIEVLEEITSGLKIKREHITRVVEQTDLNPHKPSSWKEDDLIMFSKNLWRISKPTLIVANKIDLPYAEENVERLKELGYPVVPCCAEAELTLRRACEKGYIKYEPGSRNFEVLEARVLNEKQKMALEIIRKKVLEKFGTTGVQEALNIAFFDLLNLITVYPVADTEKLCDSNGNVLPDVYLVPRGTSVHQLAYEIHTELGESFIYAVDARTKKRLGGDYLLKDRDIIKIVSAKMRR